MLGRISLAALLVIGLNAGGCDFFQELENAESAGTADSGDSGQAAGTAGESGSGGAMAGPCDVVEHDRCINQDVIASCDPATGVLTEIRCDDLCQDNANFSCVSIAEGRHGCWCVVPGANKLSSCSELETCLGSCAEPGACTDQCFGKTTETTVRTFGALVHCAESGCSDLCAENPAACSPCIANAIATGDGCSLERAVCDSDANDDPWSFPE